MAFLPGIFGKQAAQQQQQAAPAQPAPQPGPAATQQTPVNPAANPANMTGQPAAPAAGGPVNPLDSFADIDAAAVREYLRRLQGAGPRRCRPDAAG